MNCQLCNKFEATATGSHFVSTCISEGTIGKRGEEEAYEIDLSNRTVKTYFGPKNLENKDTEIKENFIVKDFIFCQGCEDLFGILENECCHPIRQNLLELKKSNHKILRTEKNNKYFNAKSLKTTVFKYFVFSLIWRQIIEHRLKNEIVDIDNSQVDYIANELLKLKGLNHKAVRNFSTGFEKLDFIILTTYNKGDTSINPIMINPSRINPLQIFFGTIMVLLFKKVEMSKNFVNLAQLPINLIDEDLYSNNYIDKVKFGVLSETLWKNAVVRFYKKEVNKVL